MLEIAGGTCRFDKAVPEVQWFSDSIPYGIGCAHIAGPRQPIYFTAQSAGNPLLFVGSQSFAGTDNGLAVNPACECIPGIDCTGLNAVLFRMTTYRPRVVIYSCGINDVIAGASAATIAGRISTGLDSIWTLRTYGSTRIILTSLLKTLDANNDVVVQAANALLPGIVAGKSFASAITYLPQIYACIPSPTIGLNMNDAVHPNDTGDAYYAAALWANGLQTAVLNARGAT